MAELVTSVAEELIEVLATAAIQKVCEMWGYKSELEQLQQTVSTVKIMLLDADAKWDHLNNQDREFVRKLRDVVYDADDVFDEFFTLAELNQLDGRLKKRGKIYQKLKGWCKVETFSSYFPCLLTLEINSCRDLAANMICPTLKSLTLGENSERLQITHGTLQNDVIKLRTLAVSPMGHVKWIPINCNDKEKEKKLEEASQGSASFLETLQIRGNPYNIREEEEEEPWKSFQHSLRNLSFSFCKGMKRLPNGMQHLTSLQSLQLRRCENMNEVPEWISCLSSLQTLNIWGCPDIKTLPEAIKHLTSLKNLDIIGCRDLEERCRKPNGEDFPKIQHIPQIEIGIEKIEALMFLL